MEFTRFDLGEILRKESGAATPRILRIVAGNPLIMKEMAKHVPDAGSYAPVTILIDERADGRVARDLDSKIEKIMATAAEISLGPITISLGLFVASSP